jgi:hypothetical protein
MKPLWSLPHLPGVTVIQLGEDGGAFALKSPTDRRVLAVIASNGDAWDHVSVSRVDRCPNWEEMEYVKRLFFNDDEVAMQLHVAVTDHINAHPYCLHIWMPQGEKIPLPPSEMVFA